MKRITLTKGQFAIVDDKDYERLNKHKWCAQWNKYTQSFYAKRAKQENCKSYTISMAREVLGLFRGDKRESDHINHITLDNKTSNLRIVTHQQNTLNRKNPARGYYWHKAAKKYLAQIIVDDKCIYLGLFCTSEKAHIAYLQAKIKYHAQIQSLRSEK